MIMREMLMKQQFYDNLRDADLALDQQLAQQSSRYTALRTISFLGMVFALAAGYDGHPIGTILGLILLLLFIVLVRKHHVLKQSQLLLRSRLAVIASFLDRFNGNWQNAAETGLQHHQDSRPQEIDLHIFGPSSL